MGCSPRTQRATRNNRGSSSSRSYRSRSRSSTACVPRHRPGFGSRSRWAWLPGSARAKRPASPWIASTCSAERSRLTDSSRSRQAVRPRSFPPKTSRSFRTVPLAIAVDELAVHLHEHGPGVQGLVLHEDGRAIAAPGSAASRRALRARAKLPEAGPRHAAHVSVDTAFRWRVGGGRCRLPGPFSGDVVAHVHAPGSRRPRPGARGGPGGVLSRG